MAHPSDQALIITVGREIDRQIEIKTGELIRSPTERAAGYIQALLDVKAMMAGESVTTTHPTQEQ